jgi:16S rRNA (cytidine1402-2'-O)-methyltransferase
MPGTLYVVATPIGNLEDVTLRALRVLREVSLIAAEDTRRTSRLLQHYSISTPTTSLHEHNEQAKAQSLVARLVAGQSIALVSDAGTPAISDPGARLVSLARSTGVRIEPVPGASALLAALSASGFEGDEFIFAGFPPHRSKARRTWLERFRKESRLVVLYEAPHRIRETLQDMIDVLGDRELLIGRELTKAHEELVVRPISSHLSLTTDGRGEYTLVLRGYIAASKRDSSLIEPETIAAEFGELTNIDGLERREAIRELTARYGLPAREVYRMVEVAKKSGE